MPELPVRLVVGGRAYGGWKTVGVTRSIESFAGRFEFVASERWAVDDYPINAEDDCQVKVGDIVLITGVIDRPGQEVDANTHQIAFAGRDAAGALVDCSADLGVWEFLNTPILDICRKVATPHGITVTLQPGIADAAISTTSGAKSKKGGAPNGSGSTGQSASAKIGRPVAKFAFSDGDSGFEIINSACRMVGLLPVSDGLGGIVLTRAGALRATTALVEGANVLAWSVQRDDTIRYRRYVVSGQSAGTDELFGVAAAAVKGEALDQRVKRSSRVLRIRAEGTITPAFAKQRAAWEATVRAARSLSLDVTVQGWTQADGTLWPINALVPVRLPTSGLVSDMLIVEVNHASSIEEGTTTRLSLAPPDAYLPEPVIAAARKTGGGAFASLLG